MRNMSGSFRGILTGDRYSDGSFDYGGTGTFFWTSVASGTSAWVRRLHSGYTGVYRYLYAKAYGFSVRCLKN